MEFSKLQEQEMFKLLNKVADSSNDKLDIDEDELIGLADLMGKWYLKDLMDDNDPKLFSFLKTDWLDEETNAGYIERFRSIFISKDYIYDLINKRRNFCEFIKTIGHEIGHFLQHRAYNSEEFKALANEKQLDIVYDVTHYLSRNKITEILEFLKLTIYNGVEEDTPEFGYKGFSDPNLVYDIYENLSCEDSARFMSCKFTLKFLRYMKDNELSSPQLKSILPDWANYLKDYIKEQKLLRNEIEDKILFAIAETLAILFDEMNNNGGIKRKELEDMYEYKGRKVSPVRVIDKFFEEMRKYSGMNFAPIDVIRKYENAKDGRYPETKITASLDEVFQLIMYGMSISDKIKVFDKEIQMLKEHYDLPSELERCMEELQRLKEKAIEEFKEKYPGRELEIGEAPMDCPKDYPVNLPIEPPANSPTAIQAHDGKISDDAPMDVPKNYRNMSDDDIPGM